MSTITWRGYELEPDEGNNGDDLDTWLYEPRDPYIGVSREDGGLFSACVGIGDLEGDGIGESGTAALEAALADLKASVEHHVKLIAESFK